MTRQAFAPPADVPEANLRQAAIIQLRKKRGFQAHLLAYAMVNLFLTAIWFFTNPDGFYWPLFPLFGWGIGLAFNAVDVYSSPEPSEERIQREIQRLSRR